MTEKLLLLVASQLLLVAAFGQPFSRQEADSMFHALEKSQPDLEQVDLLLHLAQFHIFKPGEFQADFDTAMIYVDEAKVLNKTLKSSTVEGYLLLTESYLTKERGQHDEARKMAEKAVTILESGNNNLYLGSAYYALASYYNFYDDVQRSRMIHLVEKSIKLFHQARNTKKKARALEMLGELYFANNENRKAIQVLMQALAAYDSLEYQALQGVYVILGRAYRVETDYGQALFYLLKALKTAHALGDSSILLCNINHALGELYTSIDRSDLAVKYAEAALEVARQYANENDVFFLSVNLAIKCDRNGQPEQGLEVLASIPEPSMSSLSEAKKVLLGEAYLGIYLSLGQYDKVPPLIEPLLTLVQGRSIVQDRGIIHRLIATYYFQRHQYSKARDCLMKNREPIVYANYKLTPIHDALLWYKLDSVQGNFYSAFNHLLFYKTKMDSILSENRVRQLQVLGVEYETALKEDSIKLQNKNILLLTQQNSLQQANLQQANLLKNVTIGGTAVAFAIMGLLYRLYRQKQKSNNVITQKNEQLQHFLTEKEWLLKEIHHRVKNNLQIVMSLLNSQSSFIDNEPALTAIHDSQHRVHAISLIHQKLYNTENVSSIDISFYIRELVSYLSDCFNTRQRVRFELDVERLEIDVGQAVPLGLILNEAITNAIKYAFPDGRDGVISISLTTTIPQHFELTISDNGIGIPHDFDAKKSGSLGLNLIAGLSEDLEGDFSIESNSGTTLKISFVHTQGIKGIDNVSESLASVI